jgi:hypothetical protein
MQTPIVQFEKPAQHRIRRNCDRELAALFGDDGQFAGAHSSTFTQWLVVCHLAVGRDVTKMNGLVEGRTVAILAAATPQKVDSQNLSYGHNQGHRLSVNVNGLVGRAQIRLTARRAPCLDWHPYKKSRRFPLLMPQRFATHLKARKCP